MFAGHDLRDGAQGSLVSLNLETSEGIVRPRSYAECAWHTFLMPIWDVMMRRIGHGTSLSPAGLRYLYRGGTLKEDVAPVDRVDLQHEGRRGRSDTNFAIAGC